MRLTGEQDVERSVRSVPSDLLLTVATRDRSSVEPCGYSYTLSDRGVMRLSYWVAAVPEVVILNHIPVTDGTREEVWMAASACQILRDGARGLRGRVPGAWLSLRGYGMTRYVELDPDGSVRGWPVVAMLDALVPAVVWRHVRLRRDLLLAEARNASAQERAEAHADVLESEVALTTWRGAG